MPINIDTPTIITIDKIRIDMFSVETQSKSIAIHFSRGFEDANGNFTAKEWDKVNIKSSNIDQELYTQVKDTLYALLVEELNKRTGSSEDK